MALRFQKRFKIFPGLRINLSKTGISVTVGAGPLHVNLGKKGIMATASIPGSGLSHRQFIKIPTLQKDAAIQGTTEACALESRLPSTPPPLPQTLPADSRIRTAIQSTEISAMTSACLSDIHELLSDAAAQRREIKDHLVDASNELIAARNTLAMIGKPSLSTTDIATDVDQESWEKYVDELETYMIWLRTQLDQSSITTALDIPTQVISLFENFCQAFQALSAADHIWDVTANIRRNSNMENPTIRTLEERVSIKCSMENLEILGSESDIPHIENANGGDLYFYPGFLVFYESQDSFAVVAYSDLTAKLTAVESIEAGAIPTDAEVLNKSCIDGFHVTTVKYGSLDLSSNTGIFERFIVSSYDSAKYFHQKLTTLISISRGFSKSAADTNEISDVDLELVLKCIDVVRDEKKCSVPLLQKRLRLGYTRAARMIDILEEWGVVGSSDEKSQREVFV